MWFIVDIFERYTTGVAKTFLRLAALEADASSRARAQKRSLRHRAIEATEDVREDFAREAAEAPATEPEVAALSEVTPDPAPAAPKAEDKTELAVPMGVRGDTVIKWVDTLSKAERRDVADLLEKLRKDKKVRVAELQMIVSEVTCEAPIHRKKADHLAVLKSHFGRTERCRTSTSVPSIVHAG